MMTVVATGTSSKSGLRAIWAGKIWMSSQWGKSLRGTPMLIYSPFLGEDLALSNLLFAPDDRVA
jgi:hypothetical protein